MEKAKEFIVAPKYFKQVFFKKTLPINNGRSILKIPLPPAPSPKPQCCRNLFLKKEGRFFLIKDFK